MGNFYYNLFGGLNTEMTPIKLGADTKKLYWAQAVNIEPYKKQGVTRQKGNITLLNLSDKILPKATNAGALGNSAHAAGGDLSGLNPVGACAVPKGGKNLVVGLSDGRIFLFKPQTGAVKEVWDFGVNPKGYIFTYFLDGVVIFPFDYPENTVDGIFYDFSPELNGGTGRVLPLNFKNAQNECIRAEAACQFASRLWVANNNTLYFSALGTFDDWSEAHDAGYIAKFHSSTAKITALSEYAGALAIYKDFEVFLLTGSDPESFAIVKFADKGAPCARSVLTCNNKQYFFNRDGLFSLSMVGELNQIVMGQNLAANIAKMFERLDLEGLSGIKMCVREAKNQIWIFPPIQDEKGKKEVWIYDYALECWFIREIPFEISDAVNICGEIYTLSPDGGGKIFVENKGNTFSQKAIQFSFSTPFFNFSKPACKKILEDFFVIFDGASDNNFDFYVSKDYLTAQNTLPETIFVENPNVLVWDAPDGSNTGAVWGGGDFEATWAEPYQESMKLDIFEALTSVQLHFEGNTPGQDLTIIGFEFKEILFEE